MTALPERRILMGNEAIARGIVEAGCSLAASYPGTPASEILDAVARFAAETGSGAHVEWSVNEKVAFETALANSMAGRRSAVSMKQVGLNVASDPFLRAAYLGVVGGFLVVSADDPGPHSSQTEQDSRFFAMFARVPVLDPSSPREAKEMVQTAFDLSERHRIPVMLRPTTRVCHARQMVACGEPAIRARQADFKKDARRWCATPVFVKELHRELHAKIALMARDEAFAPRLTPGDGSFPGRCLVAGGVAFAHTWDVLDELGLLGKIDLYQVLLAYPLNIDFIDHMKKCYQHIAIIEETYQTIEMQLMRDDIRGRRSGLVPNEGELTPEVIREVVRDFMGMAPPASLPPAPARGVRPTLCAGCGHRAAFYAIKKAFPRGIFPSDIGCYTLGVNLGGVDTCHCMGAGISQAAGLYHAYHPGGSEPPPLVATIGDSTFFHAGIPALINAVAQGARIIVVILDNSTTAMTGHQPTPQQGTAAKEGGSTVAIEGLVEACGVRFMRVIDPYRLGELTALLKEAHAWCRGPGGGVAVVIARRPCILDRAARSTRGGRPATVTGECTGCRHCIEAFECPALLLDEETGMAAVDGERCTGCGVCADVCPSGAIVCGGAGPKQKGA